MLAQASSIACFKTSYQIYNCVNETWGKWGKCALSRHPAKFCDIGFSIYKNALHGIDFSACK